MNRPPPPTTKCSAHSKKNQLWRGYADNWANQKHQALTEHNFFFLPIFISMYKTNTAIWAQDKYSYQSLKPSGSRHIYYILNSLFNIEQTQLVANKIQQHHVPPFPKAAASKTGYFWQPVQPEPCANIGTALLLVRKTMLTDKHHRTAIQYIRLSNSWAQNTVTLHQES